MRQRFDDPGKLANTTTLASMGVKTSAPARGILKYQQEKQQEKPPGFPRENKENRAPLGSLQAKENRAPLGVSQHVAKENRAPGCSGGSTTGEDLGGKPVPAGAGIRGAASRPRAGRQRDADDCKTQ